MTILKEKNCKSAVKTKVVWPLEKPLLVIIDMQNDAVKIWKGHKKAIPKIKALAEVCRKANIPVVHALFIRPKDKSKWTSMDRHFNRHHFMQDTEGAEEVKELYNKKDIYIKKHMFSCFVGTNFEKILKKKKIKTLIVTGQLTHVCVFATAMDALQKGYNIILPEDCISSYRVKLQKMLVSGFFKNSVGDISHSKELIKRIKAASSL